MEEKGRLSSSGIRAGQGRAEQILLTSLESLISWKPLTLAPLQIVRGQSWATPYTGTTGSKGQLIRITCAIKMYGNRFHHCTPRFLSKR